jgi:hypothetical protein
MVLRLVQELNHTLQVSKILSTLMIEAVCLFKMSVRRSATWHHIPEDGILHTTQILSSVI